MKRKEFIYDMIIISFLLLLPIFVFGELVFQHKIPNSMDPTTQFYPIRAYAARIINSGNVPLWNPYTFSGVPFLANIQTALFYPLNLLLFSIFPLSTAFGWKIALHFFIGGLFTYLYLRKIEVSRFCSLVSGVSFMLSGFIFPKIALTPILQTSVLIPLLFYTFEISFEKRNVKSILLAGISLGIAILSGYLQIVHITLLILGIYALWRIPLFSLVRRKKVRQVSLIKVFNGILIFLGMIIFYILVTEGFSLSVKTNLHSLFTIMIFLWIFKLALSIEKVVIKRKSLFIALGIIGLIVFLGISLSALQLFPALEFAKLSTQGVNYGPKGFHGYGSPHMFMKDLLIGHSGDFEKSSFIGTLPLIFILLGMIFRNKGRKQTSYFYIFLFISLFITLIVYKASPLINILWHFPGFKLFRSLCRDLSVFAFSQAVLAGIALDNLSYRLSNCKKIRILQNPFLKNGVKIAILFIIIAQLLNQNRPSCVSPKKYYQPSESINYLKGDPSLFRFFAFDKGRYSYEYDKKKIISLLIPNTGLFFNISDIQGYDPLQLASYKEYIDFLNRGKERYPYNDKYHFAIVSPSDSRLIDLLNVKYLLSKEEIKSKKYRLVYDKEVKIYENKGVLPRAFIVHRYIEEKDKETTLSWIENEIVNPAEAVILGEGADPIPLIHQLESNLSSRERKSEVKIVHYSPNKIVLNASTDKKGILFLSEIYYPGWKVYVDGKKGKILRANAIFRAVHIGKGKHKVEFIYSPFSFKLGLGISLTMLSLIIICFSFPKIRNYRLGGKE